MSKVTAVIRRIAARIGDTALDYYDREPVRVHTALATAVVAAATALGATVVNPIVALAVVTFIVPVIVQAVRAEVYPVQTVAVIAAEAVAAEDANDASSYHAHPGDLSALDEAQAPPESEPVDPRA